ncbi:hypothetical protein [Chitinophaga sp. Cy-1792]|uniref:hypothetical protein n=1 Tax=Chitinophaga sp. Cy-1792 TaxID=2608339 RepID=UPI001421C1CB|nr:hypothetical protein [Chitinophaga sp. Cy-1792]NIG54745.1 hypothetical protein [Chitinophaga sp. Cy-1792]
MSIQTAVQTRDALLEQSGREGINVMYPTEFEQYICALELVDGDGSTLKYFIFPVMPSSLEESQPKPTIFKRSLGGIVAMSSTTFSPVDISLSGTFGRKFRILLGSNFTDFVSSFRKPKGANLLEKVKDAARQVFDDRVKTGYGCLKVMEELIQDADRVDEKGPRFLIFYNLAFGNSYYVKPMSFKISMTEENNMLHNYTLALKAIAPLAAGGYSAKRYMELEAAHQVQEKMDSTVNQLAGILNIKNDQLKYLNEL